MQSCAVIVKVEKNNNATEAHIRLRKKPPSLADTPISLPLELIPDTTVEEVAVATPAVMPRQSNASFKKASLAFKVYKRGKMMRVK